MKYLINGIRIGALSLALTSCEKYLDINDNPNQATRPPIGGLMARVCFDAGLNVYRVSNTTSYYTQYLSSPNPASPTDVYEPVDISGTWGQLYDNMSDAFDLRRLAEENGATEIQGAADILMAMDLIHVHDLWGDAPYSNAFTGEEIRPAFDDAQSIYTEILRLLDEGISLLQQPGSKIKLSATDDLIHRGNAEAWVRTAHALKARMLNRVSKTAQYNASAVLAETAQAYTAPNQDAALRTFDVRNPWAQVAINNANLLLDGWLSEQLIDAMNGTTYGIFDPRLPLMTDTTKFGTYIGTPNGRGRLGSGIDFEECYINQAGYYSTPGAPLYIISREEVLFIEAEAAFRSNDLNRAYTAYLNGIAASCNKMGVPAAARDAYINDPSVSVGSAALTLDLIFKEKYKALYLSPETWNDARRFDYAYAGFTLPLNAVTNTFIRRLVYPSVELTRNAENTPDIQDVTERLWWDR